MSESPASTVWVHVTTLLNWNRPPVGIVRVEQEYCRWVLQHAPAGQVRFCAYDRVMRQFTEVDVAQVEARLRPVQPAPAASGPQRTLAGWKLRVKDALRRLIPYLPAPWVPKLRTWVRSTQHQVLVRSAQARNYVQRFKRSAPGAPVPFAPAQFQRGDRFVSLGLDWEYLDQERLYRLKQQHGLKTTLICYDVIPLLFPQLVVLPPGGFGAYFVDMAWCADAILCISEHTQRDCEAVLRRLGAPVPPTHVIKLGSELKGGDIAQQPAHFRHGPDDRPFVLFVSTIERRKNHEILYRAWTRLRDGGLVPHRLVFVGMQGWGVTDLFNDLRLDPRIQHDIVLLNHVSDAELAWLYKHAAFTVFPSLYEGWGLPACGVGAGTR